MRATPPTRSRGRRLGDLLVRALDSAVPARAVVALHSAPDLDDSVVALLRDKPRDLTAVVLAENPSGARARARALGLRPRIVPRRSPRGTWTYLRAQVTVSTHGLFGTAARPRGKQVLGLWHGEFGKLIGAFAGERPRHFDWVPVSSELSRAVRSAEFALSPGHIEVVGSPRQRLLDGNGARSLPPGRHVVWAPTYRRALRGMPRSDGDPEALQTELSLDDPDLGALLDRHDVTLWYRPHPSDAQDLAASHARVRSATNVDLEALGLTFYELLGAADCFVTDYSSLWVDHLLCDRPMVAFCPDLDTYRRDRGLALEPHEEWFPGPVVGDRAGLLDAVARALHDPAAGSERRRRVAAVLHTATGVDPVAATWEHARSRLAGLGSQ